MSSTLVASTPNAQQPVLACDHLSAGYDRLAVARDIDFEIRPGEVLAVLGPNGAGKTTLLLTLAGFLKPLAGRILLDGQPVRPGSARRMNAAGVVLVPDSRALFSGLTTTENLTLATGRGKAPIDDVLDLFPMLRNRAKVRAGMLSGGEQQMLALARALLQRPRVLLIDEMSMGLAPVIVESLMPIVRDVADETGAAVILIEQHVYLALDVADSALVLVHGEVKLSGDAQSVHGEAEALEAVYLGVAGTNAPSGGQPTGPMNA